MDDLQMLNALDKLIKKGMKCVIIQRSSSLPSVDYITKAIFAFKSTKEVYRIPTVLEVEGLIDEVSFSWQFYRHFQNRKYYYEAYPKHIIDFEDYSDRLKIALDILLLLADDNPDKFRNLFK